jgi:hypothetical protein
MTSSEGRLQYWLVEQRSLKTEAGDDRSWSGFIQPALRADLQTADRHVRFYERKVASEKKSA